MPAGVTPIEMPTQCGGAAARDRPEDGSLLRAQPRMLLNEGVTLRVSVLTQSGYRCCYGAWVAKPFASSRKSWNANIYA